MILVKKHNLTNVKLMITSKKWVLFYCIHCLCIVFSMLYLNRVEASSWQPVKDLSLTITKGSPLDFSDLIEAGEAGKFGFVDNTAKGRIKFTNSARSISLNCASLAWSPTTGGFPNHEQADIYARQLKIHGYNLVRFHFVEAMLMSENTGKARRGSFNFNQEQLDNWLYFLSALKKEGIYWLMDAMTAGDGAIDADVEHRWITVYGLKFSLHYNKLAQAHWKDLVSRILLIKNPYTGLVILKDPALIGIVLVNENSFNFLAEKLKKWPPKDLEKEFNEWLFLKYKTTAKLQSVWQDLDDDESLQKRSVKIPKSITEINPRTTDVQKYIQYKQKNMINWMVGFLRNEGYRGLITAFHDSFSTSDNVSRRSLSWIDMHSYHDAGEAWSKGATIGQTSSIDSFGAYLGLAATVRVEGKPFSLTEYGQPFWNRYRYEAGPMAASIASLQDWDFICLHASGVVDLSLHKHHEMKSRILPYGGGVDPIVRAGETLSTLLMLRRDIDPALHTLRLLQSDEIIYQKSGVGILRDFSKLAWLSKVELKSNSKDKSLAISFSPTPRASNEMLSNMTKALPIIDFQASGYIEILRNKKFLSSSNQTSILKGVLQSDNEQVLINQKKGFFQINTARTEAFVSNKPYNYHKINALTIKNLSVDGLVSVSSLDVNKLEKSDKILLIFATDAENTDMSFADSERKKILNIGKMPPRIRSGTVDVVLNISNKKSHKLYSLRLNGDIGDEIPVVRSAKDISFSLNNTQLTHGPTTYFVLVAK